jgi:cysteine-S-conjugate beta-lyase
MSESSSSTPLQNPKVSSMAKAFSQVDLDGHDLPPSPAPSSPRNGRQYSIATQLVYSEGNDQYNASSTPIYQVCLFLSGFNSC